MMQHTFGNFLFSLYTDSSFNMITDEHSLFTIQSKDEIYGKVEEKVHWALTHGIIMGVKPSSLSSSTSPSSVIATHAPFALNPYRFPSLSFNKSMKLATIFNTLMDKVSRDNEWLQRTLQNTGVSDEFTGKLLTIHKTINSTPYQHRKQQISLAINRSDYMLHSQANDSRTLLQVEINTIASSFGAISTQISEMYRIFDPSNARIPVNEANKNISTAMVQAHLQYNSLYDVTDSQIVMIVQPNERNFADQRQLQFYITQHYHNVKLVRATLSDIINNSRYDDTTNTLTYNGIIVSLFYFRSGYTPDDYPSDAEWESRLLIEKCNAIKCPNIGYHLAGCKKVQQTLANAGEVERFVSNIDDVALLRDVFAGLYNLDRKESDTCDISNECKLDEFIQHVLTCPDGYVMKPQREGGGNNLYNEDLVAALTTYSAEDLAGYIIMEKIQPTLQKCILIRDGAYVVTDSICELGIYGIYLGSGTENSYSDANSNSYGGYLLRVKPYNFNEGGVAAGYAVLSSPELV